MRKNRNAFFSENSSNFQGYNPMVANMPYQATSSNSSFYAGPGMMPGMTNAVPNSADDIESRFAKIERQISRLEHRVSKLESNNFQTTDDFESTTNNMYIL